jgi:diphosphate--fructose-6-phosphate 1-phosphotransferase
MAFPSTAQQPVAELKAAEPIAGLSPALRPDNKAGGDPGWDKDPRPTEPRLTVGVVFCGRQNPGGSNVVAGLLAYLQKGAWTSRGKVVRPARGKLLGFLNGTKGLLRGPEQAVELTPVELGLFLNQGGFELLGRSAEQLRTEQQLEAARRTCEACALDGLVLIGGRRTLTDCALLAEHLSAAGCGTRVCAVPTSIERDIRHPLVESTLGFDTATKLFGSMIANIATDARSSHKYWYFIRLMGRETSHVTLECALLTRPNVVLLAEEVIQRGMNLRAVVAYVADVVCRRADAGLDYGVVIIPDGLISAIPELATLVADLNSLLASVETPKVRKMSSWPRRWTNSSLL